MKKLIITLIILKAISLNAQSVIVGFKGGVSIFSHRTYIGSNFYESTDYGNEVGVIIGFSGKHLAFQVEPSNLFVKLNLQENIDNKKFETQVTADFVNIPILFRIKAGNEFRIFADVGVNYSILSNIEKEIVGNPSASYTTKDLTIFGEKNNNLGVLFGLGIERDFKENLFFNLGFRKVGAIFNKNVQNININSNTFIAYFGLCLKFSKQKK